MGNNNQSNQNNHKLGLGGLIALVFGLMIGVGIYSLPQNMAQVASPLGVLIAWGVTAAGILPLVTCFNWLSTRYPQYNAGIYQYAQAGFGNFIGYNVCWGYWLCTAFANVAYCVILNDSFGAFFPSLLRHGWETVVFGSVFIWLMYLIVVQGIRTAKFVNTFLAAIKVVMLVMIVGIFIIFFRADLFDAAVWEPTATLGALGTQVENTMMVTLFCFIGIEGAVMMSALAKRPKDVGRAGFIGFVISFSLYLAVSLLCYGLMARAQLAKLPNPSVAYLLGEYCGFWAYWFVIIAVILSVIGGWVAWTLIVAQVPHEAAKTGILPKMFLKVNRHNVPATGLFASSVVMELFLLLVVTADDVYLMALSIASLMIIPAYFFTGLFLFKIGRGWKVRVIAAVTSIFCIWMAYSGGLVDMFKTTAFYAPGVIFYILARKDQRRKGEPILHAHEKWGIAILLLCGLYSCLI